MDNLPQSTPSLFSESSSDTTSLSDFLFNSVALEEGFGPCIRRSDGRLYAIKKALQTQRAWSELTILRKIKENQVLFNQWLYWAFERDHCIYFIVVSTLFFSGSAIAQHILNRKTAQVGVSLMLSCVMVCLGRRRCFSLPVKS